MERKKLLKKLPEPQPELAHSGTLIDISHLVIWAKNAGPKGGAMKQPTDSAFKLIEYLAAKGMSEAAIAGCIGVSPRVFIEWKDRYPELMERLRIGQAHGVNLASEVVYRRMQLGDLTAAIFYLKKVDHWRDNGPTEAQVSQAPSALDAALSRLTPDEFNALTEIVSRGAGRAIVAGTAIIVGGAVQAEPA